MALHLDAVGFSAEAVRLGGQASPRHVPPYSDASSVLFLCGADEPMFWRMLAEICRRATNRPFDAELGLGSNRSLLRALTRILRAAVSCMTNQLAHSGPPSHGSHSGRTEQWDEALALRAALSDDLADVDALCSDSTSSCEARSAACSAGSEVLTMDVDGADAGRSPEGNGSLRFNTEPEARTAAAFVLIILRSLLSWPAHAAPGTGAAASASSAADNATAVAADVQTIAAIVACASLCRNASTESTDSSKVAVDAADRSAASGSGTDSLAAAAVESKANIISGGAVDASSSQAGGLTSMALTDMRLEALSILAVVGVHLSCNGARLGKAVAATLSLLDAASPVHQFDTEGNIRQIAPLVAASRDAYAGVSQAALRLFVEGCVGLRGRSWRMLRGCNESGSASLQTLSKDRSLHTAPAASCASGKHVRVAL